MFYYPCPCGDKFQISVDELLDGEGEMCLCATCFGNMIFAQGRCCLLRACTSWCVDRLRCIRDRLAARAILLFMRNIGI